MTNIFTTIIQTLDTIPITGEDNINKMAGVFSVLRKMEAAADAPEKEETDG